MVNIKIQMPEAVRLILNRLKAAGHEAYIVGGCVRDALLGRTPGDWDITTSALPEQVKELFTHTVDTGIQHGTVMVLLHGEGYEVTTYRIDGEYKDSRHPENVTFTPSLEEDLKRRDFTINAFAWDENGLVDLFDGLSDLDNRLIRCVGDPAKRFGEDALRIMRAVRFSAQLGFEIESQTRAQIPCFAEKLANISMERIRVEWEKTLLSPNPGYINEYAALGLAPFIIKGLYYKCFDEKQNPVLAEIAARTNTEATAVNINIPRERFLAALNIDRQQFSLWYRVLSMTAFFAGLSADETGIVMRDLKYDNKTRGCVEALIKNINARIVPDRVQIKRTLNQTGLMTFAGVLELSDIAGTVGKEIKTGQLDDIYNIAADILEKKEPWNISDLAVNGTDLISAGVPSGKKIGEFLEKILQKVIQSPTLNTKEKLCDPYFLEEVRNECIG